MLIGTNTPAFADRSEGAWWVGGGLLLFASRCFFPNRLAGGGFSLRTGVQGGGGTVGKRVISRPRGSQSAAARSIELASRHPFAHPFRTPLSHTPNRDQTPGANAPEQLVRYGG